MFGSTQATFSSIVTSLVFYIINPLVWLVSGLALFAFLLGVFQYIASGGSVKGKKNGLTFIIWGLLALFLVVSLGAILSLMCNTFLDQASCSSIIKK